MMKIHYGIECFIMILKNRNRQNLKLVYNLLYSDGSSSNLDDLEIDSVDFCTFGNSNPLGLKSKIRLNDNFTYYYIKVADSSRIWTRVRTHYLT